MSTYYTHPHLQSRSALGLQLVPAQTSLPSVDTMSRQEFSSCFDAEAMQHAEFPMFLRMQEPLKQQTCRALFDEARARSLFPNTDVVIISCLQSTWHCVWGAMETRRIVTERMEAGLGGRRVSFHDIANANHFVSTRVHSDTWRFVTLMKTQLHWDNPTVFWDNIMRLL
jgi:hypothetical protein